MCSIIVALGGEKMGMYGRSEVVRLSPSLVKTLAEGVCIHLSLLAPLVGRKRQADAVVAVEG